MATPKKAGSRKKQSRKERDIETAIAAGQVFGDGEKGKLEGATYQSRIDGNAWTPRQHPAVWVLISTE